jgi:hypothetical protein
VEGPRGTGDLSQLELDADHVPLAADRAQAIVKAVANDLTP